MPVNLRERELLAQPVSLPLVRVEVDGLRVDEGFIQAVELLLNRLRVALRVGSVAADDGFAFVPRAKNQILDEPHVARCRLQALQFVGEKTFELGLGHVDRPTLTPAVVVRVPSASSLRPARGQRPAAVSASHKTLQWEIGTSAQVRSDDLDSSLQDRLHPVERLVRYQRIEVPAP
ncbi:MAG: hypothetical protein A3H96_09515 [Acidobacteria bacterium RIFCSPLOWO2_02_FULL_67_36]|nr:MAG: hypothetical protein A3H96_09515 [Acidobacteria bacterium RIFCSPLOWO2_02_FULL_67_36]OFW24990.1 MAG: hypothetical protein A3G21_16225 [Acidobacteria bacterium RIFCSPLOWO2_12_FULL_66_21]